MLYLPNSFGDNRLIQAVHKLSKIVLIVSKQGVRIMSEKFVVTLSESALTNGAAVCKAFYVAGIDVTNRNIARTFTQNIPFSKAARVVSTLSGQDQKIVLAALDIEVSCAAVWSATYDQTIAQTGDKNQAKLLANAAESEHRLNLTNGLVHPTPPAESPAKASKLPKADSPRQTGKVAPYSPLGKPEDAHTPTQPAKGIELGEVYKIDSITVKADKRLASTGEIKMRKIGGVGAIPKIGAIVTIGGIDFVVSKHHENSANTFNVSLKKQSVKVDKPATPAVQDSPAPIANTGETVGRAEFDELKKLILAALQK